MGFLLDVFGGASRRVAAAKWCDAELTATADGIAAGTRVATGLGWRPVAAVAAGDLVLTFDHGMQPVTGVTHHVLWAGYAMHPADWPLLVPVGALGNAAPVTVLPGQILLIESDLAEETYGEPFVVIPAAALDGYRGIARSQTLGRVEVVVLTFAVPQMIFANCGAQFLCAAGGDLVEAGFVTSRQYAPLTVAAARHLLAGLAWDTGQQAAPPRLVSSGMQ